METTLLNCRLRQLTLLCLLFTLVTFQVQAQSILLTQTIKGVVIDQASEEPVMAANILIMNTDPALGAATELDGSFRIDDVPVGRYTLRISCLGYEDAYVQELEVASGKEVILNLKLAESLVVMEEVVVTGERLNGTPNNEMASVSSRSFSVEQTKRYAAAINDPARTALSFAGVSTTDDENNEIVIRGNSPRGLLWRMEGIEIPNPNHFSEQGSSGGGISALSVNVLANSDFLVSAFPAEYGNAMSGVFDLKLRNGNNEKREYAMQAGFLGLDMAAEGPIGEAGGASYLVNYRYSTLSILEGLGVIDISGGGSTKFQDAAFKVNIPTANNGYVSVWGMGGISKGDLDDFEEISEYFSNRGVVGVNNRRYLKNNDYLEGIVSYSINLIGEEFFYKPNDYEDYNDFTEQALRASLLYNRKFNARTTLRTGVIGSRLTYDFQEWYQEPNEARITTIDEDGSTATLQAYAQVKHRIGTTLNVNAGLHATYLEAGGQMSIEPRAGLRWNWRPGHVISAGAGLHSRMDPLPLYLARVPNGEDTYSQPNKELALPKAAHGVLGYEWRFHPQWRLQAEAYYQHLYDVPIASASAESVFEQSVSALNFDSGYTTDSLFSDGTGRNYGLEITVEKFFTNGWYALTTASLYRSLYTPRDGIERNTRYDGKFVFNVLAGKEWTVGKRQVNKFNVNLRLSNAGGNRVTPIDLAASQDAGGTVRDHSRAFEHQLPHYFRTDLRVAYRFNKRRASSVISIDFQNLTNQQNVWRDYYSAGADEIREFTQLGLIPILNYRLEF